MEKPMNAYIICIGNKNTKLHALTALDAKEKGIAFFRVSKAKQHLVSVHLVETDGKAVAQVLT